MHFNEWMLTNGSSSTKLGALRPLYCLQHQLDPRLLKIFIRNLMGIEEYFEATNRT